MNILKNNLKLKISSIITMIIATIYIDLVISARYFSNIELNGKSVNLDNLPFGIMNVSAFVTENNSYTTVTWLFAIFVFILLSVSAYYVIKQLDSVFINYLLDKTENIDTVIKIQRFVLLLISMIILIQTVRSGFYAALEMDIINSSLIYSLIYIVYFVVRHPIVFVVLGMIFLSVIVVPSRPIPAEDQRKIEQARRDMEDRALRRHYRSRI